MEEKIANTIAKHQQIINELKLLLLDIENSIPKKKVEEKIEKNKKEYKKIHAQHYRDCGILENRIQAKILAYQELLEVE